MNPEALRDRKYSKNTDLWSFGCIIYEIETQQVLFGPPGHQQTSERKQLDLIKNGCIVNAVRVSWKQRISVCRFRHLISGLLMGSIQSANDIFNDSNIQLLRDHGKNIRKIRPLSKRT